MAVLKPPGGELPPKATQNPSKPVADPHPKTPGKGAPGLVCPWPVAAVESDTLSGRARRGLDRALGVAGGVRGGLAGCTGGLGTGWEGACACHGGVASKPGIPCGPKGHLNEW